MRVIEWDRMVEGMGFELEEALKNKEKYPNWVRWSEIEKIIKNPNYNKFNRYSVMREED